jgi:hypothetical protein
MTTIAYRDGVLATDSYLLSGNTITCTNAKKIFTGVSAEGKFVLTGTGDYQDLYAVFDWINNSTNKPDLPDCHSSFWIFLSESIRYELNNRLIKFPLLLMDDSYATMGSGMDFALGALCTGVSAEEAIQAASYFDRGHTGGVIQTLNLKEFFDNCG